MSLRIKRLFRSSSSGKDGKEPGRAESRDQDVLGAQLPGPAPGGAGDSATLPRDAELVSPKGKKGIGLLSLRRKKKSKQSEEFGGEVFLPDPDELDRFRNM